MVRMSRMRQKERESDAFPFCSLNREAVKSCEAATDASREVTEGNPRYKPIPTQSHEVATHILKFHHLRGSFVGDSNRRFPSVTYVYQVCDDVKSMKVVTADSKIIEVDEENYPDLFWALRGGGNGSLGMALEFTFSIMPMFEVSYLKLEWDWDAGLVSSVISSWMSWIKDLPDAINTKLLLNYNAGKLGMSVIALKVGGEPFTEWEAAFKKFNPRAKLLKENYDDSSEHWEGESDYPFFKAKSKFIFEPIKPNTIQGTVAFFESLKKDNTPYVCTFDFGAHGGKIKEEDTAFFPRNALALWGLSIYWDIQTDEPDALARIRKFYDSVADQVSRYSYCNAVDYDLGESYLEAYYGSHVDRLISIKNKYDPDDLFRWQQSIPLR